MIHIRFLAAAALLAGCTVNVPNGTFNTNAPVTATANTQVNAQVGASVAPSTPVPTATESPPVVLTPSPVVTPTPTPTPVATPALQPTVQPSTPQVANGYSPDLYWRYSSRSFEFLYPKSWDSVETSGRNDEFSTCVANIARKSPTGFSDFGVFINKNLLPVDDAMLNIQNNPDHKVGSIDKFTLNEINGKTAYYTVFRNGVELRAIVSVVIQDGKTYALYFTSTEPPDRLPAIVEEVNTVFKTWTWR